MVVWIMLNTMALPLAPLVVLANGKFFRSMTKGLCFAQSSYCISLLQEVFVRLILYNYTSLIARCVPSPEGKQVDFSVGILACKQFLKRKLHSLKCLKYCPDTYKQPDRTIIQTTQSPISAIAFQYRRS